MAFKLGKESRKYSGEPSPNRFNKDDASIPGKLAYTDDDITWMGEKYERKKGKINYNGEWLPEGSLDFPWEKH